MLTGRAVRVHSLIEKAKQATGLHRREAVQPYVIGVAGGLASGRLTFCRSLAKFLGDEAVLLVPEETFTTHHEELVQGLSSLIPEYDWENRSYTGDWHMVEPHPVVVVLGLSVFSNPSFARCVDQTIFIDTPSALRLSRRLERQADTPADEMKALVAAEDAELQSLKPGTQAVVPGETNLEQAALETSARILEEIFSRRKRS
jgi:uridine kinase